MKKTDAKVKELWDIVLKKKQDIQCAEKPNWKTNCVFAYSRDSKGDFNIQTVSRVEDMLDAITFLLARREHWNAANAILETNIPFIWNNYTSEEWISDLQTRMNKLKITDKKKELNALEARLNAIISPELKAELELAEISKILEDA